MVADRGRQYLLMLVPYTMIIYSVGCVRKQAIRDQTGEHRKLISMWFKARQRARRSRRRSKWESGHGKQHVTANSIKLLSFPHHLHTPASVCVWVKSVCVHPYFLNHVTWHEQSCTVWKAPLYIVAQCWVSQQSIVGVRSSLSHKKVHDTGL